MFSASESYASGSITYLGLFIQLGIPPRIVFIIKLALLHIGLASVGIVIITLALVLNVLASVAYYIYFQFSALCSKHGALYSGGNRSNYLLNFRSVLTLLILVSLQL